MEWKVEAKWEVRITLDEDRDVKVTMPTPFCFLKNTINLRYTIDLTTGDWKIMLREHKP